MCVCVCVCVCVRARAEKSKHILCSSTFFSESGAVYMILWKNIRAGQTTDANRIWRMRFACCITTATDTLIVCNTYCFPTAMVTRTCHIVAVHCRCVSTSKPKRRAAYVVNAIFLSYTKTVSYASCGKSRSLCSSKKLRFGGVFVPTSAVIFAF